MDVFRRLPTSLWIGVLGVLLLVRWRDRRELREVSRIGADLGTYYGERDQATARREERLLDLTKTLTRLTWVLLAFTAVALIVALTRG